MAAQTIKLEQIRRDQPELETLIIRSMPGDLYLASVTIQGEVMRVVDSNGDSLRFRSILAAKQGFKGLHIEQVWLEQTSPYDEMVGNPQATGEALRVPLAHPDKDHS